MIALRRVYQILKERGKFYLKDTVYSFQVENYKTFFSNFIDSKGEDDEIANDLETAIRDEYTTFDWIMEKLLIKAGFRIEKSEYREGIIAVYVCTKPAR